MLRLLAATTLAPAGLLAAEAPLPMRKIPSSGATIPPVGVLVVSGVAAVVAAFTPRPYRA